MASIFAKFDGVDGEATDANHDKWIDVLSVDWGHSRAIMEGAKASQRTRGETQLQDVSIAAPMHKGSLKLQQNCASGVTHKTVEIHFCRTGADPGAGVETYLTVKMENVLITSYHTQIAGEDVPIEQFSLNFTKIEMDYKEADKAGKLTTASSFSWDKQKSSAA